jgi:hypothetical protein
MLGAIGQWVYAVAVYIPFTESFVLYKRGT